MGRVVRGGRIITVPVVARPNVRVVKGAMHSTIASKRIRCGTVGTLDRGCPATTTAIVVSLAMRTRTFKTRVIFPRGRIPDIIKHLLGSRRTVSGLRVPTLGGKEIPRCLGTGVLTTGAVASQPIFTNYVNPCSLTKHLCSVSRVVVLVCVGPRTTGSLLGGYSSFVLHCYVTLGTAKIGKMIVTRPTTKLLSSRSYARCSSIFVGRVMRGIRSSRFAIVLRGYKGANRYAGTVMTAKTTTCRFKGGVSVIRTLGRMPTSTLTVKGLSPIDLFGTTAPRIVGGTALSLLRTARSCPGFILSDKYSAPPRAPSRGVSTFFTTLGRFGGT